jgi:hypothetical protein
MKKIMVFLCSIVLMLGSVSSSDALTITGYDVTNTRLTGLGGWGHTYSGTITSVGSERYDYTGGSGTMNDGVMGADDGATHLFLTSDVPTITVFLDQMYTIDQIDLLSFEIPPSNGIPGNMTGVSITIGATTQAFSTIGFGPIQSGGWPAHERIDLTSSVLSTITTDQFTLSAFASTGQWSNYFSISEIELISGNPVPEPTTLLLLGSGLIGLIGFRRKFKK